MNWKLFLIGGGLMSSFILSIVLIAVFYDDSAYVGYQSYGDMPYKIKPSG